MVEVFSFESKEGKDFLFGDASIGTHSYYEKRDQFNWRFSLDTELRSVFIHFLNRDVRVVEYQF